MRGRRAQSTHTHTPYTPLRYNVFFTEKCIIYSCNTETRDERENTKKKHFSFILFSKKKNFPRLHRMCLVIFLHLLLPHQCFDDRTQLYKFHSVFTKYVIRNTPTTIKNVYHSVFFFSGTTQTHTLTRNSQ